MNEQTVQTKYTYTLTLEASDVTLLAKIKERIEDNLKQELLTAYIKESTINSITTKATPVAKE